MKACFLVLLLSQAIPTGAFSTPYMDMVGNGTTQYTGKGEKNAIEQKAGEKKAAEREATPVIPLAAAPPANSNQSEVQRTLEAANNSFQNALLDAEKAVEQVDAFEQECMAAAQNDSYIQEVVANIENGTAGKNLSLDEYAKTLIQACHERRDHQKRAARLLQTYAQEKAHAVIKAAKNVEHASRKAYIQEHVYEHSFKIAERAGHKLDKRAERAGRSSEHHIDHLHEHIEHSIDAKVHELHKQADNQRLAAAQKHYEQTVHFAEHMASKAESSSATLEQAVKNETSVQALTDAIQHEANATNVSFEQETSEMEEEYLQGSLALKQAARKAASQVKEAARPVKDALKRSSGSEQKAEDFMEHAEQDRDHFRSRAEHASKSARRHIKDLFEAARVKHRADEMRHQAAVERKAKNAVHRKVGEKRDAEQKAPSIAFLAARQPAVRTEQVLTLACLALVAVALVGATKAYYSPSRSIDLGAPVLG